MLAFVAANAGTLLLLLLLLGLSGFFSGTETALFSLTRERLRSLRHSHVPAAGVVVSLMSEPRRLLVAILLGNMIINVLFFSLSAVLASEVTADYGGFAGTMVGVSALFGVILFGEVFPKAISVSYPLPFAVVAAVPMSLWLFVTRPVAVGVALLARMLEPRNVSEQERYLTPQELKMLVTMSQHAGALEESEQEIIEDILELSEIRARELMTPRVDIVQVDIETVPQEAVRLAREHTYSLLPAYEGSVDHIVGIVSVRDLVLEPGRPGGLRDYCNKPVFVPETSYADSLLRQMLAQEQDMAVVVDEYGGTAGLLTLEDLFETFVGSIRDEFEAAEETSVQDLGDNRYRVDGRLSIREWRDLIGLGVTLGDAPFPPQIDTVGGFLVYLLDRLPHPGDQVTYRNLRMTVEKVQRRRVDRVLLELIPQEKPEEEGRA